MQYNVGSRHVIGYNRAIQAWLSKRERTKEVSNMTEQQRNRSVKGNEQQARNKRAFNHKHEQKQEVEGRTSSTEKQPKSQFQPSKQNRQEKKNQRDKQQQQLASAVNKETLQSGKTGQRYPAKSAGQQSSKPDQRYQTKSDGQHPNKADQRYASKSVGQQPNKADQCYPAKSVDQHSSKTGQRYPAKPVSQQQEQTKHRQGAGRAGERSTSNNNDKRNRQQFDVQLKGYNASKPVKASSAEDVAIGERIVVTIKRIGINGEGVGYYKRKAVFVEGAITDEVVKAKVTKVERSFLQAQIIEIEKSSPDRQTPPCPVYEQCGGCQLQHMTYEAQLKAKEEIVREAFSRYTELKELPLRPIYGMEEPWHYRNKAQLQMGWRQEQHKVQVQNKQPGQRNDQRNQMQNQQQDEQRSQQHGQKQVQPQELIAGLYAANSHKLIDISECTVQEQGINEVYKVLKQLMVELEIAPYDERTRSGYVKTVVVRIAKANGQMQITFVTATDSLPQQRQLVQRIRAQLPNVITIAHNVHKERSSVIFGPKTIILWGEERLPETLGSIQFALSPRAFFQLNPTQTIKLYDAVKEAAKLGGNELVVDAYCGTGTISLWLAEQAREVRGVELIAEAVQDARSNAQYSGIDNALFYEGRAEQLIPDWVEQGIRPDVIVVDPPRTGLDAALIDAVLQAKPERFVYVSCNPSTLAKDCKELLSGGYELEWVQPVDMFPWTSHVESVCLLTRK